MIFTSESDLKKYIKDKPHILGEQLILKGEEVQILGTQYLSHNNNSGRSRGSHLHLSLEML